MKIAKDGIPILDSEERTLLRMVRNLMSNVSLECQGEVQELAESIADEIDLFVMETQQSTFRGGP